MLPGRADETKVKMVKLQRGPEGAGRQEREGRREGGGLAWLLVGGPIRPPLLTKVQNLPVSGSRLAGLSIGNGSSAG